MSVHHHATLARKTIYYFLLLITIQSQNNICHQVGQSDQLKMYDFNRPLEALKIHTFNTGKNKFLQVFGLLHLITLAMHLN